jgi:hypothetical protein
MLSRFGGGVAEGVSHRLGEASSSRLLPGCGSYSSLSSANHHRQDELVFLLARQLSAFGVEGHGSLLAAFDY